MRKSLIRLDYVAVGLLLLLWGSRLWQLDALPIFIDEVLIVLRGQMTLSGSPIGFGTQGKYLLPWLAAPLMSGEGLYVVVRVVALWVVMLGGAGAYAIGKGLSGEAVGRLALLLMIFTPMLYFHDRMALADTSLHGVLMIFVWGVVVLFSRAHSQMQKRRRWAIGVGCMYSVAILAKATAITLLPLPIVAAVLLPMRWTWRDRMKALGWLYGTVVFLWLPFQAILTWRGVDFWDRAREGSTLNRGFINLEQWMANLGYMVEGLVGYWGIILLALLVLGWILAVIFQRRTSLFLLALILGYAVALIIFGNDRLYYRYWLPVLPPALILLAIGCVAFGRWLSQRFNRPIYTQAVPAIVGIIWLIAGVSFILEMATDPVTNRFNIPFEDRGQYFVLDSAGTNLPDIATFLAQVEAELTVGLFTQCEGLRLYLPATATVDCLHDQTRQMPRIVRHLDALPRPFYIVVEMPSQVDLAGLGEYTRHPVAQFERPSAFITVTIYDVGE